MRVRSKTAALALASATVGTMLIGSTSPASAYPSNCWHSKGSLNGGIASCASGTGSYRVVIGCKNPFGWWATRYGPWYRTGSGYLSRATCPAGYLVQWSGLNASG